MNLVSGLSIGQSSLTQIHKAMRRLPRYTRNVDLNDPQQKEKPQTNTQLTQTIHSPGRHQTKRRQACVLKADKRNA